jgi:hypothetical protein
VTDEDIVLVINKEGIIEMIYDDSLLDFLDLGAASIQRASHVEPEGKQWIAQMVDGPVLGPFKTRAEALMKEREYLEERMFR